MALNGGRFACRWLTFSSPVGVRLSCQSQSTLLACCTALSRGGFHKLFGDVSVDHGETPMRNTPERLGKGVAPKLTAPMRVYAQVYPWVYLSLFLRT
jgi:hypothetical protein